MRSWIWAPIIAGLLVAGCQERSVVPRPQAVTEHQVKGSDSAQVFAAATRWLHESFTPEEVVLDIQDPVAGLLMGKITIKDGAQTVVGTGMPLRITVMISIRSDGYRVVFDNFLLPKRWFGRTPAGGKELESAMQTALRLETSLTEFIGPSAKRPQIETEH